MCLILWYIGFMLPYLYKVSYEIRPRCGNRVLTQGLRTPNQTTMEDGSFRRPAPGVKRLEEEKREHGGYCDSLPQGQEWLMIVRPARRGTPALLIHREHENMRAIEKRSRPGVGRDVSALIS